jgi:hypothetical protein
LLVAPLGAQSPVRLIGETAFLKEPGGLRLATIMPGVRLTPGRVGSAHAEVTIQGWIFTTSTKMDKRDGLDLSVKLAEGENLRALPDGPIIARVVDGTLFSRIGSRGGWTQVRRTGWVPQEAVTRPPRAVVAAPVPLQVRESAAAVPKVLVDLPPAPRRGNLRAGTVVQRLPDGAPLATLAGPSEVTLGERDREWVRVRVDGWVRQNDVDGTVAPRPAITAEMLRESPDRYLGQTVDWRLQFLAHQRADELRPEMPLGHPYLLARGPLPETGFVYVLVSKEQADRLQGLKPLDELAVMVTVRAARTRFLATPVVELLRLGGGN